MCLVSFFHSEDFLGCLVILGCLHTSRMRDLQSCLAAVYLWAGSCWREIFCRVAMGAPKWGALGLSPIAGLKSMRGICPSPACKVISGLPTFWISTFSKYTFTRFTCFCKTSKAAYSWLPLPTVYFCLTNYPKTMWLGITILVCS